MIHTWNRPASSPTAFALLLSCCAVLILRPAEILPSLNGLPIYEALVVGALLFGHQSLMRHFGWQHLKQQPATLCVVGVLLAVVASHLSHFYFYGVIHGAIDFLKTLLFFGLVASLTNTVSRMRKLLVVLAVSATAAVGLCVIDYLGIEDFTLIDHIVEANGYTSTNDLARVTRMRGIGIFQDPNDLSLLIVFAGVICTYFLLDRSLKIFRFGWLFPLSILVTGLICTKSRGGLMGAGVACMAVIICRYGKTAAIATTLLGACALPLIAGRQADIDLGEGGTAHERITLWREGLVAMRSHDILFGIGQGFYADWAGLVAHNSFVHAFVELGLVGGTLFLGCFFFPALALIRLRHRRHELQHPELRRLYPFIVAMLTGWTMGLQSLSRTYVVSTYVMLGIQVAYVNLAEAYLVPRRLLTIWDRPHLVRLAACSAVVFVGFNVFVIVFAR